MRPTTGMWCPQVEMILPPIATRTIRAGCVEFTRLIQRCHDSPARRGGTGVGYSDRMVVVGRANGAGAQACGRCMCMAVRVRAGRLWVCARGAHEVTCSAATQLRRRCVCLKTSDTYDVPEQHRESPHPRPHPHSHPTPPHPTHTCKYAHTHARTHPRTPHARTDTHTYTS